MKCTPLTLRAASARTAANYMYHDRDHEHDHAYEENPLVRAPRGRACEARQYKRVLEYLSRYGIR